MDYLPDHPDFGGYWGGRGFASCRPHPTPILPTRRLDVAPVALEPLIFMGWRRVVECVGFFAPEFFFCGHRAGHPTTPVFLNLKSVAILFLKKSIITN
jgi:hypothetical protein